MWWSSWSVGMHNASWMPSTSSFPNTKSAVLSCDNSKNFGFNLSIMIINAVMAFIAFSMNALIIVTFIRTSSLRSLPSNVLILGLAISDLLVGAVVQPLFCALAFTELRLGKTADITINIMIIKVFNYMSYQLAGVSFLTLSAITADRFLAIHLHLRYQELVTARRYGMVLVCIWLSSLSIFMQGLLTIRVYITFAATFLFIVVLINLYMIFQISRVIRRHSVQIQAQQQSVQQSIDMPRYKKSVNTMFYVMGAFLLCYMPLLGTWLLRLVNRTSDKSMCDLSPFTHVVSLVSITLVLSNSIINPVIYCWRITEMRQAVKKLIQGTRRQVEDQ